MNNIMHKHALIYIVGQENRYLNDVLNPLSTNRVISKGLKSKKK
jgi:hypothetical protein